MIPRIPDESETEASPPINSLLTPIGNIFERDAPTA